MADGSSEHPGAEDARIERAWREHRARQVVRGLELTPLERLRWLETNLAEIRGWLGRARTAQDSPDGRRAADPGRPA